MITNTDKLYATLVELCRVTGQRIKGRNHAALSVIDAPTLTFHKTPLVTLKKTAWRKALREMEWFLSGDPQCPNALLDWWGAQLYKTSEQGHCYFLGYGHQLRRFGEGVDQVEKLIQEIKEHPYSRRHVVTTWNPADMARIAYFNHNPNTPTTCHGTVIQAFVRSGHLHFKTYQRSADIILGVPHNWIQYWGFLLWLAHETRLLPGTLQWIFGDLHLYDEPSHLAVADAILDAPVREVFAELVYVGQGGDFRASNFELHGTIPEPVTGIRAALL